MSRIWCASLDNELFRWELHACSEICKSLSSLFRTEKSECIINSCIIYTWSWLNLLLTVVGYQRDRWLQVYYRLIVLYYFTIGKICDNPILQYSNPIFSGNGSREYTKAWFSFVGWCASGSAPYLSIDLRKEYHITRVVTMGDKDQTKWSGSYSMKYSRDKRLVDGSSAMLVFVMT